MFYKKKKSRIRETKNLWTNADRRTDTIFKKLDLKKKSSFSSLFFAEIFRVFFDRLRDIINIIFIFLEVA